MNFYLNKNNQALAEKIHLGLKKIANNGQLKQFMGDAPHSKCFPFIKLSAFDKH
jgi:hypothetical protein